jgi:hypothetical protein
MDTIQEKIEKLKRNGKNYTKEQFLRLFQLVSRNNIIKVQSNLSSNLCINKFNEVLKNIDEQNTGYVPTILTAHLEKVSASYDVLLEEDIIEMRNLKNYLDGSNQKMQKEIIEFIKSRGRLLKPELGRITQFINNLSKWNFDIDVRNATMKISDDGLYNYINYFKNMIELVSTVFPKMIINQQIQTIKVPKYWNLHTSHADDIVSMISNFYKPIQKFYGNSTIANLLNEILERCKEIYLLSCNTPVLTSITLGEKELYSVFDKRTTTLLYEYYLLSILNDYIHIVDKSSIVKKILVADESDFIIERELQFAETLTEYEEDFIQGSIMSLKKDVASLLVAFINIMMDTKETINVSYENIQSKVFKSKEAEKYNVTDEFKKIDEEAREIENILKNNKLGLWNKGLKKGLKQYVKDDFEDVKYEAEKVDATRKKMGQNASDNDVYDVIEEDFNEADINDLVALEEGEDFEQEYEYNDIDGDSYGDGDD